MSEFEFILQGRIAVDSGMLSIADPCYWDDERMSPEAVTKAIEDNWASDDPEPIVDLGELPHAGCSMGVVFPTATGDGIYDVYAVFKGEEIQGMFVSFLRESFDVAEEN